MHVNCGLKADFICDQNILIGLIEMALSDLVTIVVVCSFYTGYIEQINC